MNLVVVSPEHDHPHEHSVLAELFAAGLTRFHVRKPHASPAELADYLGRIPSEWRPRVVLHQHHHLAETFGLGGRHWPEAALAGAGFAAPSLNHGHNAKAGANAKSAEAREAVPVGRFTSRSCHDMAILRVSLGRFDSVFFGPVFPSISKPGYGPRTSEIGEALRAQLQSRDAGERSTAVIAIGGINLETVARAGTLGFDGVAVLGAVWLADEPVDAFRRLESAIGESLFATAAAPGAGEVADNSAPNRKLEGISRA